MNKISLSHASWLRPFEKYFHERGTDLTSYYKAAEIRPDILTRKDGWLTKQQIYQFLNLVSEGEQLPELGFVVGETITPDTIDGLNTKLMEAVTLDQAIHHFCRLINRHVEDNRAWLEDGDSGDVWFLNQTLNPFSADRHIADHAGLMTLINVVRLVAGPSWYPEKALLQTGETEAIQKVSGLRNTDIQFNAPATGLAFPSIWIYHRLQILTDRPMKDTTEEPLLKVGETASEKLLRLLWPLVGTGGMVPSLDLTAHICRMNSRTLQRRLHDEGETFGSLLERVRIEKAEGLLLDTDESIKEIAWEIGYSGPNNFIRAFKRRKNITPNAFRRMKLPPERDPTGS